MAIKNTKTIPICAFCGSQDVTVDVSISCSYNKLIVKEISTDNPFCNVCMKNQEIMWEDPKIITVD